MDRDSPGFIAVLLVALLIAALLVVIRIDLLPSVYPIFLEVDSHVKGRELDGIRREDVVRQSVYTNTRSSSSSSSSNQQTIHHGMVVVRSRTVGRLGG